MHTITLSKTNYILFRPNSKIKILDEDDTNCYSLTFGQDTLEEKFDFKGDVLISIKKCPTNFKTYISGG